MHRWYGVRAATVNVRRRAPPRAGSASRRCRGPRRLLRDVRPGAGRPGRLRQAIDRPPTHRGSPCGVPDTADGARLYLGNDGGAYRASQLTAAAPSYKGLNPTLEITQFYPGLSIAPGNPKSAIGGTQDNGTVLYSGSLSWNDVTCGDGGYTAIDPTAPATIYAACQDIFIQKSTASGAVGSWTSAMSGIDTADRVDFIAPMVLDRNAPRRLYFGTYRVWQTTDGAASWQAISPDLTNGPSFWGVVTSLAVAPSDSNTVYAGTGDGNVQVTSNAGAGAAATWTNLATPGALPPRVLTGLAVDPGNAATGTLRAATHGRGAWDIAVAALP